MAARTSASLPVASKSIPEPEPNVAAVAAAMAPPVKPAALSVSGELERLFYLKEKGALTDEEYIVQKAKLLA